MFSEKFSKDNLCNKENQLMKWKILSYPHLFQTLDQSTIYPDECEIDSNKNKEESFEVEDSFGVLDNYSGTKSAMERHHEYTKKSLISKEVPLMGV